MKVAAGREPDLIADSGMAMVELNIELLIFFKKIEEINI